MGVATTALVLRLRTDDNDGRLRRTQLRERMRSERGAKRDGVPVRVRGAAMTVDEARVALVRLVGVPNVLTILNLELAVRAEEREACAVEIESMPDFAGRTPGVEGILRAEAAARIRARKERT